MPGRHLKGRHTLTEVELKAIELLIEGVSNMEVGRLCDRTPRTIMAWQKEPRFHMFQEELKRLTDVKKAYIERRMLRTTDKALDALEWLMDKKTTITAHQSAGAAVKMNAARTVLQAFRSSEEAARATHSTQVNVQVNAPDPYREAIEDARRRNPALADRMEDRIRVWQRIEQGAPPLPLNGQSILETLGEKEEDEQTETRRFRGNTGPHGGQYRSIDDPD